MVEKLATRGQLERELSQNIQAFYCNELGHRPSKVTCQLFDEKLAVIMEDSITNAERILIKGGEEELAEKVHSNLDDAIKPELQKLIENIIGVEVIDILSDATLSTGRTGIIVVLNKTPKVRDPKNIPKVKRSK